MKQSIRFGRLFLWFLQGLLVFLLIFEDKIELPLAGIGHLHPLILHLPIGFGVLLFILWLVRNELPSFQDLFSFLLLLTSVFSSITAILGLFLAKEGGYESGPLAWHQWLGVSVSFAYFLWVLWPNKPILAAGSGILLLIAAGHTGASITHGEDYLQFGKKEQVNTDESLVFEALVQPILKSKCESCHNDQKTKGGLKMNSIANLLKGGKNGPIWKAGDVLNSHMLQRIALPLDAKKHMPPAGKTQLTAEEQMILTLWVKEGASFKKTLQEYSPQLQNIAKKTAPVASVKTYDFSAASESDIQSVNTPFCTVYPIAYDSPGLQATFFVAARFEKESLENLSKVKNQLVGLNLNKMPITDAELTPLSSFTQLEKLYLNGTQLTGKGLDKLASLTHLEELSIASTQITGKSVEELLKKSTSLKKVYIWNSAISSAEIAQLKNTYPKVVLEQGFIPSNEIMRINPPILVNENMILRPGEDLQFKHTLRGVTFRYTLNDSIPDSLRSPVTTGAIKIQQYGKVRILATKSGWYASNPLEFRVYKSNHLPDEISLLTPTAPNYPAKGAASLIDFVQGAREVKGVPNFTWLGFKETDFDAIASFKESKTIKGITLSYLEKTDADVFPPSKVEVWAGMSKDQLKRIAVVSPVQPKEKSGYSQRGINISLPAVSAKYYRIKAERLRKLPAFVDNKGKGAWLRIDELLFY